MQCRTWLCDSGAILWPLALYFLENFVNVYLSLELEVSGDLSRLMASWKYARGAIVAAIVIMAVVFPFDTTNGTTIAEKCVFVIGIIIVLLPLSVTLVRLAWALRQAMAEIPPEGDANTADASLAAGCSKTALTRKRMNIVSIILAAFGVPMLAISAYMIVSEILKVADLVANREMPWMRPECNRTGGALLVVPVIMALLVTRSPSSQRRSRHNTSQTLGTSTNASDGKSTRDRALSTPPSDKGSITPEPVPLELDSQPPSNGGASDGEPVPELEMHASNGDSIEPAPV